VTECGPPLAWAYAARIFEYYGTGATRSIKGSVARSGKERTGRTLTTENIATLDILEFFDEEGHCAASSAAFGAFGNAASYKPTMRIHTSASSSLPSFSYFLIALCAHLRKFVSSMFAMVRSLLRVFLCRTSVRPY